MSRARARGRWEPADGARVDRQGVPLALRTYPFLTERERQFYTYLCTQADREGVVQGPHVSQAVIRQRLAATGRTLGRWTANLIRLRTLRVSRVTHQAATYHLRPPTAWITERASGFATPEDLAAHFGPAHRPLEALRDRRRGQWVRVS